MRTCMFISDFGLAATGFGFSYGGGNGRAQRPASTPQFLASVYSGRSNTPHTD